MKFLELKVPPVAVAFLTALLMWLVAWSSEDVLALGVISVELKQHTVTALNRGGRVTQVSAREDALGRACSFRGRRGRGWS
jgi:hypothetical protein